jgi:hypothetical protein
MAPLSLNDAAELLEEKHVAIVDRSGAMIEADVFVSALPDGVLMVGVRYDGKTVNIDHIYAHEKLSSQDVNMLVESTPKYRNHSSVSKLKQDLEHDFCLE